MQAASLTIIVPFRNVCHHAVSLVTTAWCKRVQAVQCILADDHSEDDSFAVLSALYANCKHVTVMQSTYPQGKKHTLRYAIERTETTYVMTIDADVAPPPFIFDKTLHTPAPRTNRAALYILPLTMPPTTDLPADIEWYNRLCVRLQQTEYTAIQSLTLLSAEKGHPVMCSGANLIVERSQWLDSFNDLHPDIPSGDDMFLLESFKRKGLPIATLYGEVFTAQVQPLPSITQLFRQRMRWAGKAPAYRDIDILFCGTMVLLANLLALFPPFFVLKYIADGAIILKGRSFRLHLTHPWRNALLLSLVYPWYVLISVIGGVLRGKRW